MVDVFFTQENIWLVKDVKLHNFNEMKVKFLLVDFSAAGSHATSQFTLQD